MSSSNQSPSNSQVQKGGNGPVSSGPAADDRAVAEQIRRISDEAMALAVDEDLQSLDIQNDAVITAAPLPALVNEANETLALAKAIHKRLARVEDELKKKQER